MAKHLNPLEKEFLVRQFKTSQRTAKEFAALHGINEQSIKKWATGVCSFKGEEFEIVKLLSRDYPIKDVCKLMSVSRAGYYKWLKHEPTIRDHHREEIVAKVREVHERHRTHGYRWTAAYIRINMHMEISDSYAYKCFRHLGIKAETKHCMVQMNSKGSLQIPE